MNIPGLGLVNEVKNVVLALLFGLIVGLVFGGGAGWRLHGWKVDSAKHRQEEAVVQGDAKAVVAAQVAGAALEPKKDAIAAEVVNVKAQLKATPLKKVKKASKPRPNASEQQLRIPQPVTVEEPHEKAVECPTADPADDVLSVYAVGVLNHALDPAAPDPAQWHASTKQAASEVGVHELSDKLAEVAGACRTLGVNYDAVMISVEKYQRELLQARGGK